MLNFNSSDLPDGLLY